LYCIAKIKKLFRTEEEGYLNSQDTFLWRKEHSYEMTIKNKITLYFLYTNNRVLIILTAIAVAIADSVATK